MISGNLSRLVNRDISISILPPRSHFAGVYYYVHDRSHVLNDTNGQTTLELFSERFGLSSFVIAWVARFLDSCAA